MGGKSVHLPNYHDDAVIDRHDVAVDHVAQVVETATSTNSTVPA
jgi:hypothetical protein